MLGAAHQGLLLIRETRFPLKPSEGFEGPESLLQRLLKPLNQNGSVRWAGESEMMNGTTIGGVSR